MGADYVSKDKSKKRKQALNGAIGKEKAAEKREAAASGRKC